MVEIVRCCTVAVAERPEWLATGTFSIWSTKNPEEKGRSWERSGKSQF